MDTTPRWLVPTLALVVALVTVAGMAGGVAGGPGGPAMGPDSPCTGTVTSEANGQTVISVQGAKGGAKNPAHLVGVKPNGELAWAHDSSKNSVIWSYDLDPLPNGNLFVTTTIRENNDGDTVVYEFNPRTGKRVWEKRFDALDTHDADLLNGGREIVVANMRNPGEDGGENDDRIFIYNRTQGEITWEWHFSDHFDESVGGNYSEDWTHVNDVDAVGDDQFLISPRNFDQALIINRTTKEIDYKLGEYGNRSILHKQHNPDFLEGPDGEPTILVADSENDRVVEYTFRDGSWERTWMVSENLNWPRDADRLPNGNTLIVDSWNHRAIEVTPEGEVVWEVYTPYLVYDAERIAAGDGSNGPTMLEQGTTGSYEVSGGEQLYEDESALQACFEHMTTETQATATPFPETASPNADSTDTTALYGKDVENSVNDGPDLLLMGLVGAAIVVLVGGLVYWRSR